MGSRHLILTTTILLLGACSSAGPTMHDGSHPPTEVDAPSAMVPSIVLLDATAQSWIAGMEGGGRGVNYRFKVMVKGDGPVRFTAARIGGTLHRLDTYVLRGLFGSTAIEVAAGDTAELSAVESSRTGNVPVHMDTTLHWNYADRSDSVTIPAIRVLPPQLRP